MSDGAKCPNCYRPIKKGMFGDTWLVTENVAFINEMLGKHVEACCSRCQPEELLKAEDLYRERGGSEAAHRAFERQSLRSDRAEIVEQQRKAWHAELTPLTACLPILTLHHVPGWSYQPVGLVTAQAVLGTGLFAEIGSAITDSFGMQSGIFREKLRKGETLCREALRRDAILAGAHAVIGTDVDYSEVGGVKAMLMVCMAGTAIKVDDPGVFGAHTAAQMLRASEIVTELKRLGQ